MSGNVACRCPNKADRVWIVYKRNYNTSAFNGSRYTPSDYSSVHCRTCGGVWRTKADYVHRLPDGSLV